MDILKEVLSEIKPKKKDKEVYNFVNKLRKKVGKQGDVIIGGSFAKDTHLKDNYDVDIFVRFNKKNNLSERLEGFLKDWDYERIHGSRDYFKIGRYEIVPVLNIDKPEDAENVTDMSPLHVKWVIDNSDELLRDDIRLLKQFCKGIGVYGAESYIKGFSGHVVDILVIYYGGFLKVLKNACKWKEKEIIDYYNYHKGKVMWNINKSKLESPLIVVDPVLPYRNAAAALSVEKFRKFIDCAKEFLKKPSKKYFKVERFDAEKYDGIVLEFEPLNGKEDVVGAKSLKVFEFIKKGLKEFGVVDSGWEFGKMWFKVKNEKIGKEYERVGPSLKFKEGVKKFREKHKKTYVKKGKVCCLLKRKYVNVVDKLEYLLSKKYVKEKVKCIQLLN
jgi:tRNA nucleotidyltransferase (CCA-adding enzyme)